MTNTNYSNVLYDSERLPIVRPAISLVPSFLRTPVPLAINQMFLSSVVPVQSVASERSCNDDGLLGW